jgi:DNA-binding MarR family transcriptional regulator
MLDRMSDASRIVELLRKKEMIERNVCTDNRRKMNVVITHKGLRLLETIEKENDKMDMRLYSLNEQEINQLNYLLDKLRNP